MVFLPEGRWEPLKDLKLGSDMVRSKKIPLVSLEREIRIGQDRRQGAQWGKGRYEGGLHQVSGSVNKETWMG